MTSEIWLPGTKADLDNCAREPIHLPGRIQPHGVLLALREPDLVIDQASVNCATLLGRGHKELLGKNVESLFGPELLANLRDKPSSASLLERNPLRLQIRVAGQPVAFDGIVHRSGQSLLLELEPTQIDSKVSFINLYHRIQGAISSIEFAQSLQQLCDVTAAQVRKLTGFDRVMIYQFDPQWNGRVIAESRAEDIDPFLGLQYPASDIPQQARELYLRNWLRLIPDVGYTPAELASLIPPGTVQPLDLTFSVLRSVSPLHIEYLKNMQVGASMSVSIIRDGKLWGLIACHHRGSRFLDFDLRLGCEFIGKFMSLQITARERSEDVDYKDRLKELQPLFFDRMQELQSGDFLDGLVNRKPDILELTGATGAAIVYHGSCKLLGQTPGELAVLELTRWLTANVSENIFVTDSLATQYPAAPDFKNSASGLLALRIPEPGDHYVLWFRPEVLQTVNWAGQPDKAVQITAEGTRLSPRKSFELWKETVRLRSLPWKLVELEAAEELRRSLIDVDLGRQVLKEKAARDEAERSNQELDQFAYVVSHDLKEPLRGIEHYSAFVLEDEAGNLSPEGRSTLKDINILATRTQTLLTSLHQHSKIGRVQLSCANTDLNEVVLNTVELLKSQITSRHAEIVIPRPLPTAYCDFVRIGEVFSNLISNALKYNTSPKPLIEIGYTDDNPHAWYVKDNGIGIAPKHQEVVFGIFKRLHGADEYGGGSGSGLAIAKRIIERHQGRIWIDSGLGRGSTFLFTLSAGGTAQWPSTS